MSEKANYFKIGLFVIIGTLLFVIAIVLFGGGKFFRDKYYFETYFDQSILGLSVGAPVKVLGVDVGAVSEITFVTVEYKTDLKYILVRGYYYTDMFPKRQSERVFQEELKRTIDQGFRLQLASQGVTGIAFLNGVFFKPYEYPPYEINWKPEYFYIPSAPSTITTITDSITELTRSINEIKFKEISDELQNLLQVVTKTVEEAQIATVSKDLQKAILEFKKVGRDLDSLIVSRETRQSLTDLTKALEHVKSASEGLPEVIADLRNTLNRLDNLISHSEQDIKSTIENVAILSEDLKQFLNTAKRYPSWVLFGNPPPNVNLDQAE